MSYNDTNTPRDYGGWRRRRGIGMFGFGAAGTAAVLGALLVLIITATADAAALLYLAPPVLLASGLGLARIGGEPLAVAALRRTRCSCRRLRRRKPRLPWRRGPLRLSPLPCPAQPRARRHPARRLAGLRRRATMPRPGRNRRGRAGPTPGGLARRRLNRPIRPGHAGRRPRPRR